MRRGTQLALRQTIPVGCSAHGISTTTPPDPLYPAHCDTREGALAALQPIPLLHSRLAHVHFLHYLLLTLAVDTRPLLRPLAVPPICEAKSSNRKDEGRRRHHISGTWQTPATPLRRQPPSANNVAVWDLVSSRGTL
ncbi:uncharacterized protein Tco025E_07210 [Trypanosoma conorhini]|uniref:Uncharacterized protein n=1 Tax=Trypanosoma conorhini TaxID=83891 RepID=A0A3R7KR98_9TRYP|nr:uncharacterized protein Tco025E_07210 [Trypanosoma conorhini]RNF08168.1 hypothetical protein Tco025E_07210 [Trypanosoma conorhini]